LHHRDLAARSTLGRPAPDLQTGFCQMKRSPRPPVVAALLLAAMLGTGRDAATASRDGSPGSDNHSPVIVALKAFPDRVRASDSIIVICRAVDPDADTLVYDWITDGRLRIKGAPLGAHARYNTHANSQVFFPQAVAAPTDTAWVQCIARDRRGKSDHRLLRIVVRQHSRRGSTVLRPVFHRKGGSA
jgi:hypothetical protein